MNKKQLTFNQALIGFILPLIGVISLVLTGNNIVIALFAAVLIESFYCLLQGFQWSDIEDALIKGGSGMLGAVLIMILVGIMIAVWMASGTIPALLYYGMKIISPRIFLPVTFILCMLTALATGTSWGAAGTMGIALIGVASGMGMPLPMVAGAIIAGAIIGDKMSPLSDSVLLASASSGTSIFDLIPCMFYTTVPLGIVCLIAYWIMGLQYGSSSMDLDSISQLTNGLSSVFRINVIMLIPLLIVLVMSAKKCPGFLTFTCGILSGIILAVLFQGQSLNQVLDYAVNGYVCHSGLDALDSLLSRGGALSMGQIVFASLMAGMFSGSLKYLGTLDVLMSRLKLVIKNSTSLVITTVCVCIVLMMGGGGQYSTLTLPGAAFGDFYKEMDVHSAVLGRTMEDVGTMIEPIIPWTVSGIYYSGLFGVTVAQYFPFTIIAFLSPVLAIVNAIFGFGIFHCSDPVKYNPFWRRKDR
ncbi:MAG TPA: Na+/H+ antiporter NhaC [Candidatus Lachnoclostridium pullistercoris]|uniref:Na+/H+ antiporter NhaC n=1 Tax=Candidatus Lachnoclostridium pullistercoris TaxID=2838632 RepID=A0A9D2PCJ7_9FIRM|nr:Na+/H+ antiporter NhaC [Candidatus Lachnoclostridium pullistercoris]